MEEGWWLSIDDERGGEGALGLVNWKAARWYLYRLSHTMFVACSSATKFGDATSCSPSSRSCPTFTSSLTDSRRQCGVSSRLQQGEWPNLRTGVPRGVRPRTKGTLGIAGVAVLLAVYPGRTDVMDMPGTQLYPRRTIVLCGWRSFSASSLAEIPSLWYL